MGGQHGGVAGVGRAPACLFPPARDTRGGRVDGEDDHRSGRERLDPRADAGGGDAADRRGAAAAPRLSESSPAAYRAAALRGYRARWCIGCRLAPAAHAWTHHDPRAAW
ncbi:hypothetical protein GCM10027187_75280 [Streptosporangium sandarakinum]